MLLKALSTYKYQKVSTEGDCVFFVLFKLKRKRLEVKRVFVASDDPKVLTECRSKYPNFTFIGDEVSMLK